MKPGTLSCTQAVTAEIPGFISGSVTGLLQSHWESKYGHMNNKIQIAAACSPNQVVQNFSLLEAPSSVVYVQSRATTSLGAVLCILKVRAGELDYIHIHIQNSISHAVITCLSHLTKTQSQHSGEARATFLTLLGVLNNSLKKKFKQLEQHTCSFQKISPHKSHDSNNVWPSLSISSLIYALNQMNNSTSAGYLHTLFKKFIAVRGAQLGGSAV